MFRTTKHYCRDGEYIRDKYTCTYGCPLNQDGDGLCSKCISIMLPVIEEARIGGNSENISVEGKYTKTVDCPDGCVILK